MMAGASSASTGGGAMMAGASSASTGGGAMMAGVSSASTGGGAMIGGGAIGPLGAGISVWQNWGWDTRWFRDLETCNVGTLGRRCPSVRARCCHRWGDRHSE